MYLRDLGESLFRRWYLMIVGVVIAAGLATIAANSIAPTYQAKSSLVLVPPETTTGTSGNPYLFLGGLQQSVDVLTRALGADNIRAEVAKRAPAGTYDVTADFGTSAPILLIEAKDSTSNGAQLLLDSVKKQVPLTLGDLQESLGVKTGSQITSVVVTTDDKPQPIQKGRYRAIALVGVMALGLGFLAIGAIDGLLLARTGRKPRADEAESADPEDGDSEAIPDLVTLEQELRRLSSAVHQSP